MNILEQEIDAVLNKVKIETRDNSDMALMGDTRGNTLWRIRNREEIVAEISKLIVEGRLEYLLNRLAAAEAFINVEGQYYATWERKFGLFKAWRDIVAQEKGGL